MKYLKFNYTLLQTFIFFLLVLMGSTKLNAQLKVGSNPKTLAPNIILEVESTSGNFAGFSKDSAFLGIGTLSPTRKLEIQSSRAGAVKIVDGTQGYGKVLSSDSNGVASWRSLSTPDATVDVTGLLAGLTSPNSFSGATFSPDSQAKTNVIYINTADGTQWTFNGTRYVTYIAPTNTSNFYLANSTTDASNNKTSTIYRNGKVGLGTNNPLNTLHLSDGSISNLNMMFGQGMAITGTNPRIYIENTASTSGQKVFQMHNDAGVLKFNALTDNASAISPNSSLPAILSLRASNNNVGIGLDTANSKLEVNGSATNKAAFNAGSSSTIDFSLSNLAYTTNVTNDFTLQGIKDGGAYTLGFLGIGTSTTATFSASGFSFIYIGTVARSSGKRHIYNFIVMGTNVFVTMGSEN